MLQIGWPQLIWLLLTAGNLFYTMAKHGQPKPARECRYNGWTLFVGSVLGLGLLYWGGFFG